MRNNNNNNNNSNNNKLNTVSQNIFNICFLIMFFFLSFTIFYINNYYYYIGIILFIILFFIINKTRITDIFKFNVYTFFSFTLIIFITNLFLMTLYESINILIKLILACNLSFVLSIVLPSYKLINTLDLLLKPLNILKINTQTISLIISIGITFIPILINEIQKIRISLTSKGIKYNSLQNIFLMIKVLIPNLLKKVNDIESSLIAKGVNEE